VRTLTTWYKGSTIVIQSILPAEFPGLNNSVIEETNRQLAQIAKEHHAEYLDVYTSFVDGKGKPRSEYLNDDGVHLTGKGYEAWSNAVERFLRG
jgi:lysophospholipase L1-like esterase